jgi:hypothetical protein
MPIDPAVLATDINTGPLAGECALHLTTGNDQAIANIFNLRRATIQVNKGYLTPDEVVNAIVYSEYSGGGTGANIARQYVDMLMSIPRINVEEGSQPRAGLLAVFAAGTTTRANLIAAATRTGSRAEELFGRDTSISSSDVAKALRP